jgi:hypothetical protein
LSHLYSDGSERPIAYASRTGEKNYAQLEKEALALIFWVKRFHKYLYGRRFTLVTDHKPLLAILGSKKSLSTLAVVRLQRWAIFFIGIPTWSLGQWESVVMLMGFLAFPGNTAEEERK